MRKISAIFTLVLLTSIAVAKPAPVKVAASERHPHAAKKVDAPAVVRAKAALKVAKAVEKVSRAIEACEQAVVDACVELAPADGSASCEDADLKTQFQVCH